MTFIPNADLTVGADNTQRWNQPAYRRHGFHNAHRIFRRVLSLRSPRELQLHDNKSSQLSELEAVQNLTQRPEISALICVQKDQILLSHYADDFPIDQPHSIQSITKLFIHLIVEQLVKQGLLELDRPVEHYLPEIESGYRGASLQSVMDMDVTNDFSEDYMDPYSACFDEEVALGWRLPPIGVPETTLSQLVHSIKNDQADSDTRHVQYRSANTDLLTLICDKVSPGRLTKMIEEIITSAGIAQSFYISLSAEGLPAFSGGGCCTAEDLARIGLLLAKENEFTSHSIVRPAKTLPPPRDHVRYSNHLMTNGHWLGHAGYGGQFLMVDPATETVCVFLSVLENDAGYCIDYMAETIVCMENIIAATA